MSLECPSSPVYHTSAEQKLKSKNAAKLYRFGTPKLRDLLREKCRIRIKDARQGLFEKSRTEHLNFNDILRQELAELEHDIDLQQEIYQELQEEFNEWFTEQLQQEENYLLEAANSSALICPICQINNLVTYRSNDNTFSYRCKCNASLITTLDPTAFQQMLNFKIDLHEQKCLSKLNFYINPITQQLEAMCDNCDYFCCL